MLTACGSIDRTTTVTPVQDAQSSEPTADAPSETGITWTRAPFGHVHQEYCPAIGQVCDDPTGIMCDGTITLRCELGDGQGLAWQEVPRIPDAECLRWCRSR